MNTKPRQRIEDLLARNQAFWSRSPVDRPLLGVAVNITFPLFTFSKQFSVDRLTPDMLRPEDFFADWDRMAAEVEARGEDLLMVASPFAGIPWMEAIAGCEVHVSPSSGSIWAVSPSLSWDELRRIRFDANNPWLRKLIDFSQALREHAQGRYPIGNPILRGLSDILSTLLGPERMVLEFYDHPAEVKDLIERCTEIWHGVAQALTEARGLFYGGSCADRRRVWGKGTTLLYQEDGVALLSPRLFRQYLLPKIVEILRPYANTMIHTHSATLPMVVSDLCALPELKAIEVQLDPTGPRASELLDTFREILRHKGLVICGEMTEAEIEMFMTQLPTAGLCLLPKVEASVQGDSLLQKMVAIAGGQIACSDLPGRRRHGS